MGDDGGSSPYKNSFTLTAAKLNLSNPLDAKLLGVYLYVGERGSTLCRVRGTLCALCWAPHALPPCAAVLLVC